MRCPLADRMRALVTLPHPPPAPAAILDPSPGAYPFGRVLRERDAAWPPTTLPAPQRDQQVGEGMIYHARNRRHEVEREEGGPAAVHIELNPAQPPARAGEPDGTIFERLIGHGRQQSA